jgi:predicted TIM-barrel fold metal-dependent hydrolase
MKFNSKYILQKYKCLKKLDNLLCIITPLLMQPKIETLRSWWWNLPNLIKEQNTHLKGKGRYKKRGPTSYQQIAPKA